MFHPKLIGILRTKDGTSSKNVIKAFHIAGACGVEAMEITSNSKNWQDVVSSCSKTNLNVGVGSIKNKITAIEAVKLGAKFLVSPGLFEDVVSVAKEYNVPILPGVFLETEVVKAKDLGVTELKFFPANVTTDEDLFKAIKEPYRDECEELESFGHKIISYDSTKVEKDAIVVSSPTVFYEKYLEQKGSSIPRQLVIKQPIGKIGLEKMKEVVELVKIWNLKTYAVGGIKSSNVQEVMNTYGAYGICIGSSIFNAEAIKDGDFDKVKADVESCVSALRNNLRSRM